MYHIRLQDCMTDSELEYARRRGRIMTMLQAGRSYEEITDALSCSHALVARCSRHLAKVDADYREYLKGKRSSRMNRRDVDGRFVR